MPCLSCNDACLSTSLFYISDVNEMDVELHGWVSTPPVQPRYTVHERALYFKATFYCNLVCALIRMAGIVRQSEVPASTTTVCFLLQRRMFINFTLLSDFDFTFVLFLLLSVRPQRSLHYQRMFIKFTFLSSSIYKENAYNFGRKFHHCTNLFVFCCSVFF